jgi:hypothetical protein
MTALGDGKLTLQNCITTTNLHAVVQFKCACFSVKFHISVCFSCKSINFRSQEL